MDKEKKLDFHHLFWYFIIFSVIGLSVETLFCYITTGVIESRKGLILGPVCPIYGVGAVFLIYLLNKFKDNDAKIFFYGAIIGTAVEYILSFILEAMYGSRFWDYGYRPFNLNGRVCLTYSLYWAILSIILMKYVKPKIDKWIDKIPGNKKIWDTILLVFFTINCLFTIWGINTYQNRVKKEFYGIVEEPKNSIIQQVEDNIFSTEFMLKTFPNLRTRDELGNEIFVRDLILK